jgi:hypothetical protein
MDERTLELLTYDFKVDDEVHDFSEANPWTGRLGDFECRLPDQRLEARPIPRFASEAEGRAVLEPLLLAWELRSELFVSHARCRLPPHNLLVAGQ